MFSSPVLKRPMGLNFVYTGTYVYEYIVPRFFFRLIDRLECIWIKINKLLHKIHLAFLSYILNVNILSL